MSATISATTITSNVTLGTSGPYLSPLTIASDGAVAVSSGNAITGPGTQAWTVENRGTISASSGGSGVYLQLGGVVSNAGAGALIKGSTHGVIIAGTTGTVTNQSTITGQLNGIYLTNGGDIANTGGQIDGNTGVKIYQGAGFVTNSGTIAGTTGYGVNLYSGGSVTNLATALIYGKNGGIVAYNVAATITNYGTILGGNFNLAAFLDAGGRVDNRLGLIEGFRGVYIYGGTSLVINSATIAGTAGLGVQLKTSGTIVNSGTISGGAGTAISFGGTGSNLLVLENGYSLVGGVYSSPGATTTLELVGAAGAVTVDYNGLTLANFDTVAFGVASGYSAVLEISNSTTLPAMIAGFVSSLDTIDLTGLVAGTVLNGGSVNGSDQLLISNGTDTVTLQLDPGEDYTGIIWAATSDGSTGTDVSPVCYCRGTLILKPEGEVAIEELAIGDEVITLSGAARPVKWIGRRAYDGRFVAGNRSVLPVRISAGALADGVPARDLRVSPGHALYFSGMLVRAEHLVNGATIVQENAADIVEYFHIELETHDILVAEGAAAESYVDCDNRAKFHNAAEFTSLYPDDERPRWQYCAPLLEWEALETDAIRAALIERAATLGHHLDLDPDLHLVVDGAVVRPAAVEGCLYRFTIPAGSAAASLVSRSVAPAEVWAAARDLRRLGVPVERLVLYDGDLRIEAGHGHAGLADGFHDDEATHRWTAGRAHLPEAWLRAFHGTVTLEVHLFPSGLGYWREAEAVPARVRDTRSVVA